MITYTVRYYDGNEKWFDAPNIMELMMHLCETEDVNEICQIMSHDHRNGITLESICRKN
jgi:hypothetical protein